MFMTYCKKCLSLLLLLTFCVMLASVAPAQAAAAKNTQKSFSSPDEALKILIAAVRDHNTKELVAILGPGSKEIISSGDPVADKSGREEFLKLYDEKSVIEGTETGRAVFIIGSEDFPYPVPLVKKGNAWRFDAKAGKEELLNRRIGKNELATIEVMRAYVEAQREYASKDRDSDTVMEFAQKFRSSPGKKDGLFWEAQDGGEASPLGSLVAKADSEGYVKSKEGDHQPYHGYLFKILKAQGANVEGGAFNYVANGKMILGFALVAYPAEYGVSGIMTFVVNQNGIVYQKDLGKKATKTAAAIKSYNPDKSWKKVE